MDSLAEFIDTNPFIIITMFLLSVGGAIITIGSHRKQLWRDFLSKKITLPVYACLIFILVGLFVRTLWPAVENRPKPIHTVQAESFGVQRIRVDGNRFVKCDFDGTEFLFTGEAGFGLEQCTFRERPRLVVDGPAAKTFYMLHQLYKDPGFRPMVEGTFESIRTGQFRRVSPPSSALDR